VKKGIATEFKFLVTSLSPLI